MNSRSPIFLVIGVCLVLALLVMAERMVYEIGCHMGAQWGCFGVDLNVTPATGH